MINGEALGGGSRNKMTQQRQKHWGATLALVVGIALLGPSAAWGQKLRVAYTAFAGTFTVLWVGADSGLYKKYGADMELLYIGSSTKAVQALLGGDIDIVYSAAGAVVDANLAGADLSMIGCQYDTGQTSFFTTNVIASVGDLKGKAVGVTRFGAFSDFVARHVLKKHRLVPVKDVALLQLGGTLEIIAGMQNNLVQGGSISMPLTLNARRLGFRELMTTDTIGLPFDYGCFIVKGSQVRNKREELKKVLRATIAAYDLAIQDPAFAKRTIGKYTRTNDNESLDATYKENVKDYALRVPFVSQAGLSSILDFRAENTAEAKKLSLEKMYDNSLLQEIQKESSLSK
jgi:ABC-type nitrate/sulfonate/bicarbonate transport system substrate-binding protein